MVVPIQVRQTYRFDMSTKNETDFITYFMMISQTNNNYLIPMSSSLPLNYY